MLRYQHSLATASDVHRLSPLVPVNHSVPFSSPESPDSDDSSSTNRYHHPTIISPSHLFSDHRFSDPDNDDDVDRDATGSTPDDVDDQVAAAAATAETSHYETVLNRSYNDEDNDEVSNAQQRGVNEKSDRVATTSLSPATRRRLLEMLPALMSAASYKRLVDEGHVAFPDRDDPVDVTSLSPSTSGERQEKPDYVEITTVTSTEEMPANLLPPSGTHELGSGSVDRRLDSSMSSSEREGHAVYACHICDFLCKSSFDLIVVDEYIHCVTISRDDRHSCIARITSYLLYRLRPSVRPSVRPPRKGQHRSTMQLKQPCRVSLERHFIPVSVKCCLADTSHPQHPQI